MSETAVDIRHIDADLRDLFRRGLDGELETVSGTRQMLRATGLFAWVTYLMFNTTQMAFEMVFASLHQWGRTHRYDGLDVVALVRAEKRLILQRESGEEIEVDRDRRQLQMVGLGDGRRMLVLLARPNATWMRIERIPLAYFDEPPPRDHAALNDWRNWLDRRTIASVIPIQSLSP